VLKFKYFFFHQLNGCQKDTNHKKFISSLGKNKEKVREGSVEKAKSK